MLQKETGRLSEAIILAARGMASPGTYRRRFGSLARAYALAAGIGPQGPGI